MRPPAAPRTQAQAVEGPVTRLSTLPDFAREAEVGRESVSRLPTSDPHGGPLNRAEGPQTRATGRHLWLWVSTAIGFTGDAHPGALRRPMLPAGHHRAPPARVGLPAARLAPRGSPLSGRSVRQPLTVPNATHSTLAVSGLKNGAPPPVLEPSRTTAVSAMQWLQLAQGRKASWLS